MENTKIQINDFSLLYELMKSLSKAVEAARFQIDSTGLCIYSATQNRIARCETYTDAITTEKETQFIVESLQNFVKVLSSIKDAQEEDYSDLQFTFDGAMLRFNSKKIKLKLTTCNEAEKIQQWLSKKFQTAMKPVFEFQTTNNLISRICKQTYIHSDISSVRFYLSMQEDMEKNAIYASVGNRENNLNNELTMKFGLVNSGKIDKDQVLILDVDRMCLFNIAACQNIKIELMDIGILKCTIKVNGKNNTGFTIAVYTSPLKS